MIETLLFFSWNKLNGFANDNTSLYKRKQYHVKTIYLINVAFFNFFKSIMFDLPLQIN